MHAKLVESNKKRAGLISRSKKTKNAQQIRAVMVFFGVTRILHPCHVGLAPSL